MKTPMLTLKLGKKKKVAKGTQKISKKTTDDDTKNYESDGDEESSSGP
jgi:hypothetical protein